MLRCTATCLAASLSCLDDRRSAVGTTFSSVDKYLYVRRFPTVILGMEYSGKIRTRQTNTSNDCSFADGLVTFIRERERGKEMRSREEEKEWEKEEDYISVENKERAQDRKIREERKEGTVEIDERRKTTRREEKLLEWRLSLLLFVSGLDIWISS